MRRFALLAAVCLPLCLAGCDLPTGLGINPDGSISIGGNTTGTTTAGGTADGIQITRTNVDPSKTTVSAGETLTLSVTTNKNASSYSWTATGGSLSSHSDNPVDWTAPMNPGSYRVDVTVSDGSSQNMASFRFTVQ